jgi:hypothetical protein
VVVRDDAHLNLAWHQRGPAGKEDLVLVRQFRGQPSHRRADSGSHREVYSNPAGPPRAGVEDVVTAAIGPRRHGREAERVREPHPDGRGAHHHGMHRDALRLEQARHFLRILVAEVDAVRRQRHDDRPRSVAVEEAARRVGQCAQQVARRLRAGRELRDAVAQAVGVDRRRDQGEARPAEGVQGDLVAGGQILDECRETAAELRQHLSGRRARVDQHRDLHRRRRTPGTQDPLLDAVLEHDEVRLVEARDRDAFLVVHADVHQALHVLGVDAP